MDAALEAIYNDPVKGGGGIDKLYREAKKAGLQVSLRIVKEWLVKHKPYQENAPNMKDRKSNWFSITAMPNSWVADSIIMSRYSKIADNKKHTGFLMFMELTTRMVHAIPFTSQVVSVKQQAGYREEEDGDVIVIEEIDKPNAGIENSIRSFVNWTRTIGHPIVEFSSDNGKEFDNAAVRKYFAEQGITQRFHRKEDHRANGLLNNAVRIIRRTLRHLWERPGATFGVWLPNLDDAVENWNTHYNKAIKASPKQLETNTAEQDDLRASKVLRNREVWQRTQYHGQPNVLRFLRRNTEDKGLFEKEGKTWSEPYKLGPRKPSSYSYTLLDHAGNEYKGGRSYRPYELKEALGRSVQAPAAQPELKLTRELKAERQIKKEGVEPANIVKEPRAIKTKEPPAEPENPPKAKKVVPANDGISIPNKLLDFDWGTGKNADTLRFKVQWRDTPEFRAKWESVKGAFESWGKQLVSWVPYEAAFKGGLSVDAVKDPYDFRPSNPEAQLLVVNLIASEKKAKRLPTQEEIPLRERYRI